MDKPRANFTLLVLVPVPGSTGLQYKGLYCSTPVLSMLPWYGSPTGIEQNYCTSTLDMNRDTDHPDREAGMIFTKTWKDAED